MRAKRKINTEVHYHQNVSASTKIVAKTGSEIRLTKIWTIRNAINSQLCSLASLPLALKSLVNLLMMAYVGAINLASRLFKFKTMII